MMIRYLNLKMATNKTNIFHAGDSFFENE